MKESKQNGGLLQRYEAVIGLEIHCQLKTESKMFCSCSTAYGALPNHHVCPVCLGHPGVLPTLNNKAVDYGLMMALSLNSKINKHSTFARKQYFYPDLPKNYQITQFDQAYCSGGSLTLENGRHVRLERIHFEEDAGKNIHEGRYSYVDLNRAGTPLIEIVSMPDIRGPKEAAEFMKKIRAIARALDASDGNLEEGSFRCDANVSLRLRGETKLGVKCEIKNLNSFRHIEKAITYEIVRQADILDSGESVEQYSLLWDAAAGKTKLMRKKGDGEDYRYFPDPDLPALILSEERIKNIKNSLPELPEAKISRYCSDYSLSQEDARRIAGDLDLASFFEQTIRASNGSLEGKQIAAWICSDFLKAVNENNWDLSAAPISPKQLAELFDFLGNKTISGKISKMVFSKMISTGKSAGDIIKEDGLVQVTDTKKVTELVSAILKKHPAQVEEYHSGKVKMIGFFVGQIMKESGGKLNPGAVNKILKKELILLKKK